MEPIETQWNSMEPNGSQWNTIEPISQRMEGPKLEKEWTYITLKVTRDAPCYARYLKICFGNLICPNQT